MLVFPAFAIASEVIPVFSRKAIFGYPAMVAASVGIGFVSLGVWAHHMFTVGMTSAGQRFLRPFDHVGRHPDRDQDFQLAGHHVGRKNTLPHADAFLHRVPVPISGCWAHRHHAVRRAVELAASRLLLRDRAFPLRAGRRDCLQYLRRDLLLVPQSDRPHVGRERWANGTSGSSSSDFMSPSTPCTSLGFEGMPRWIYTYPADRGWTHLNLVISIGGLIQVVAVLIFAYNLSRRSFTARSQETIHGMHGRSNGPPPHRRPSITSRPIRWSTAAVPSGI